MHVAVRVMLLVGVLATPTSPLNAKEMLRTNERIWSALTPAERTKISDTYFVDVAAGSQFGVLIDAQVVDESTPSTSAGAAIGEAYGSATYIDRAFKGSTPSYSARDHVTSSLLGAIIGSAMDQPAQRRFRIRYVVRDLAGNVSQIEQISDQPFRQPVGVCVTLPALTMTTQSTCDTEVVVFRARYLATPAPATGSGNEIVTRKASSVTSAPGSSQVKHKEAETIQNSKDAEVRCRIGTAGVVSTSAQNCIDAEGEIIR
ncbi:hypothetical protein [Azospirillum argentinense]